MLWSGFTYNFLPWCALRHSSGNHRAGRGCWASGRDSVALVSDNTFQRLHRRQRSIHKSDKALLAAPVLCSQYNRMPSSVYCPEEQLVRESEDGKLGNESGYGATQASTSSIARQSRCLKSRDKDSVLLPETANFKTEIRQVLYS